MARVFSMMFVVGQKKTDVLVSELCHEVSGSLMGKSKVLQLQCPIEKTGEEVAECSWQIMPSRLPLPAFQCWHRC